jgi:hypothetical protein
MPVPLYLSGAVKIFAFLDLAKNFSFSDSLLDQKGGDGSNRKCEIAAEVKAKMQDNLKVVFTSSQMVTALRGTISISMGIPTASPFCKGGLRGIF